MAGVACLLLATAGCGAGALRPAALPAAPAGEPWSLAAADYPTQRVYRANLAATKGDAALRLTLRLAGPERFQLTASDVIGRALWGLDYTAGGPVLLVDHRQEAYCRYGGAIRLPELALEALPLAAVPSLLLGRLPAAPMTVRHSGPTALDFQDRAGRRWQASFDAAGALRSWSLWQGGKPLLWWIAQPGGGLLSHRDAVQLRWRQTVLEPMTAALAPLTPPAGYREGRCDGADLP